MFKMSLLVGLFFMVNMFSIAQQKDFLFRHLTTSNGLSQNNGMAVCQDYKGFMWLGTSNGLNKYNGYEFTVYKKDSEDSTSISDNTISFIQEDSDKNLWIGTRNGLNLYNQQLDKFTRFKNNPRDPLSLSNNSVITMLEDRDHNIWIGTEDGLNLYNKKNKTFSRYWNDRYGTILSLFEDNVGNLWIGTNTAGFGLFDKKQKKLIIQDQVAVRTICEYSKGLLLLGTTNKGMLIFDKKKKLVVKNYSHSEVDNTSIGNNTIYKIFKDSRGNIWVGTENGGLNLFDPDKGTFARYVNDINKKNSISNNSVSAIFEDTQGNIWAGVHRGGYNIFNINKENFSIYQQEPCDKGLSNNNVKSFCQDKSGNIWIGTDGGGLNLFDYHTKTFTHFKHNPNDPNSISGNVIMSICEDYEGNIWAGTYINGLNRFDKKKNKFHHYMPKVGDSTSLNQSSMWWIFEDRKKNLWIGVRNGGLALYNRNKDNFTNYVHDPNNLHSISSNIIYCIYEDKDGNIWIATRNGLNLLNTENFTFKHFFNEEGNNNSLSNNEVYTINEDTKGNLWIGTRDGLNLFDYKKGIWKSFGSLDGFPSDIFHSLLSDDKGNMWIGTQNGLVQFAYEKRKIKIYNEQDGLQGIEFSLNASMKSKQGELFFGGNNGFNSFFPDSLKENTIPPPIFFTSFKIFNKPIDLGPNSPLKENINQAKEIVLNYDHSVFSFEFAALNLIKTEKNNYAYMMEGFDKEWIYIGNKRSATYTNLNPGKYIFKVKASNNDGYWTKVPAQITIIINPPFWATWWFRGLMILIIVSGVFLWYRMRIHAINEQKKILEKQVKERTAEVLDQKEEILSQREELEYLYKEVKDSIKAAQSIQESLLPEIEIIKQHIPESFVFYKPKDDVSGDFYWFDVIDNNIILAAADCTGHGVSGAFMSINGYHLLNKVIYENPKLVASEILDNLNNSLIREFKQHNHLGEIHNGMDIALCIIDKDTKTIQYAGAICPLYLVRNNEIIQFKSDRFPIGLQIGNKVTKFRNNEIKLQKDDIFYIFSDGYPDQIGEGGDKFMYNRFRELLINISTHKMEEQHTILSETFENWKGNQDQLDDVLVLGFKVND